ncbi:hypothetical protein [Niveibacterium sp.]|uniref:hypothetical protein n=1 Tax=Niveibacterium sp. TaxID=2017444 RepID=UPI0035B237F3
MNQAFLIRRLFGGATLCAMLSACGGGGDTEPPPPPPEQPAAATEITASNMDTITSAALFSANTAGYGANLGSIPLTTSATSSTPLGIAVQKLLPALATVTAGAVPTAARSTPPTLAMSPPPPPSTLPPIDEQSCSGGGKTSISVIDINSNKVADPGEPFRFQAVACQEGDITLQGSMDLTVVSLTQSNGSVTSAKLEVIYNFNTVIGGRNDYIGGSLSVDLLGAQGVTTTTMRGTPIHTLGVGDQWLALQHDSYAATMTDLLSGASSLDFSSKFHFTGVGVTRPIAGSVVTRTTSPLVFDANGNITSGAVRVTIDGKPAIMDVNVTNGVASISLDTDGNGSIDTTHNVTIDSLKPLL